MNMWIGASLLVTGGVLFCSYLVALGYVATRWRDYPRPTRLLFFSILILFFSLVLNSVAPMLAARSLVANQLAVFTFALGAVCMLLQVVSLTLVVAAVYVDRPPVGERPGEFLPGDAESARASANPFETPNR